CLVALPNGRQPLDFPRAGNIPKQDAFPQMGNLARRLAGRLLELRGETPQYLFARRLGISKSSLNRIELGDQNVSLRTLDRLCGRLRCDVAELFPLEGR